MATSTELLGQLQQFQASRKKPQDILAEQENKLGVSGVRARQAGLRGAIQNTENLLKNVDPSVTGRTSGSLVTEAQRTKMVSNERAPIAEQFTEQSRALEGETANLADLSSSARTAAQLAISADDAAQSNLQSLYGFAYQREQDEIAKAERERAFRLQEDEARRQAAAAASQSNYLKTLFGGGGGTPTPSTPKVDPQQQKAYNAVRELIATNNKDVMKRTYEAIQKSAGYGNTYDAMKLKLLQQMGYSYLGGPLPGLGSLASSAPKPAPAPKTNGLFQGNAQLFAGLR